MQCTKIFTLSNFEALLDPLQIIRSRYSDNKSVTRHKLFLLNLFFEKVVLIVNNKHDIQDTYIFFNIRETESFCAKHWF